MAYVSPASLTLHKPLAQLAGCWTNCTYIIDSINIILIPKKAVSSVFAEKYEGEGLTTHQIAQQFGVSRQLVSERLKSEKVAINGKRYNSKDNYLLSNPPYGFKVFRNKLVENRDEIKIAKIVVNLRKNEKLTWAKIANKLNDLGYTTRRKTIWKIFSVWNVFNHWKNKI